MEETVSKVDAASRQLVTAIRLFVEDKDSISVYTLAHAAREVFEALCKHEGKETFRQHVLKATKNQDQKRLHKLIIGHRDFFKHATRDPYSLIHDFSDELNEHILLFALEDCARVTGKMPIEAQVFQMWYFAIHPEKLSDEARFYWAPKTEVVFPDINEKTRYEKKKLLKQVLEKNLKNESLIKDPKTDTKIVK